MIRRAGLLFSVILVLMLAMAGCSDDSVVPTDDGQGDPTGLITGDIDASGGGFEFTADFAGDENNLIPGPFIIRGTNVHYVDSLSALSVDFAVENRSRRNLPEPIGMTFVVLLPPGVTVQNPDNDEHGPGAAIVFEFANDDGVWTPMEESFPRTVHFGVDRGVSIAFVARIDVGDAHPDKGTIGGVVWHDANKNGVPDRDEPGIGGVEIHMYRVDGPEDSMQPEILWRTLTARDGSYRFGGLDAGQYEVYKLPRPDLRPTTPEKLHVILVEEAGEVSDFLMADFGCVPVGIPRPVIEKGDFVDVFGKFNRERDGHIVARWISLVKCNNDRPQASVIGGDGLEKDLGDIDVCDLPLGGLMGPVTDINTKERVLWVMGTPVHFAPAPPDTVPDDSTGVARIPGVGAQFRAEPIEFEDVEVGDRVFVYAFNYPEHRTLEGIELYKAWSDTDEVHGRVDEVLMSADVVGLVQAFVAMRTRVLVTADTKVTVEN